MPCVIEKLPATGFTTIQAAISRAGTGNKILVETGNGYNEFDTVGVADLTIEADTGQAPVLDGTTPSHKASAGFTITTTGVTIAGLTIQNFSGPAAVDVPIGSASLTLSSDVIQKNSGYFGGGLYNFGTTTLTNCTVSGNTAANGGGIDNAYGTVAVGNTIVQDVASRVVLLIPGDQVEVDHRWPRDYRVPIES